MFGFVTALEEGGVKYSPQQTVLFSWERLPHWEFHFFILWVSLLPQALSCPGWEAKVSLAFSSFLGSIFLQMTPMDKRFGKLGFQWSKMCCDYWGIYLLWSNYFILSQFWNFLSRLTSVNPHHWFLSSSGFLVLSKVAWVFKYLSSLLQHHHTPN